MLLERVTGREKEGVNMPLAQVGTGRALHPAALAVIEGLATVSVSVAGERNDWYAEAATADAILVAGETFVTGEVMDRIGPRLRIIARTGIGVDRIDLDAATQRDILVIYITMGCKNWSPSLPLIVTLPCAIKSR